MRQYAVIKKITGVEWSASVVREFDTVDNAMAFRSLMVASEAGKWEYYVVKVLE